MQVSRPRRRRRDLSDRGRDGATFQNKVETARLRNIYLRPGGCDATLAIKMETAQTSKWRQLRTEAEMARPRINSSRPRRRWRDFPDQSGDGATFQTEAETARPRLCSSRMRWIRSDFPDQGRDGAPFQTKRRRNFSDQGGYGATFQTKVDTARTCGSENGLTGATKLGLFLIFQT